MKRIIAILLTLVIAAALIFLTGCAEVTNIEVEVVQAELTGTSHTPTRTTIIYNPATKMPMTQVYPADYNLHFMYGGQAYGIDVSSDVYYAFEGKVGNTFDMELVTTVYDNDKIKRELRFPEGDS